MKEVWKDIKGYEGLYKVSNLGNVKSLPRRCKNRCSSYMTKERILSQIKLNEGYLVVNLFKNGIKKGKQIHRLVAEAFIPNPLNLPQVNHKKEFEKTNNRVDNLEWCTQEYNLNYGTCRQRQHESNYKKVYQYSKDGMFIKEWGSAVKCKEFGFDESCIRRCCRKNTSNKTHKGYIWSYEKL